ncbi:MAG: GNAT family N-acetyltransferase [Candidatus Bathyarchaeota archaeon]|nr:GNAT family N-acetyltransferase [Candidatus Bathyarchaeota archaeon]
MSDTVTVEALTPKNYREVGCPCFMAPSHEGHQKKLDWLSKRFAEGFTIKLLFAQGVKKPIGFIEYVPGEYAWRAVDAKNYVFIHCVWMNPNKYKNKGYGSLLVEEAVKDSKAAGKLGVAVVTSDGAHMAGKELFLKNGFEVVETQDRFELLVKQLKPGAQPKFKDWKKQLNQYTGLNVVYSMQCPWVARSIPELQEIAKENGLDLKVTPLKTAKDAQNAPNIYATFTLINDGRIYADHYISNTRFKNILKKELKLSK